MSWLLTAATVLVGIVVLLALMLVKRPPDVKELGRVSNRWIADHRVDWL
jgi:hypothetical protein